MSTLGSMVAPGPTVSRPVTGGRVCRWRWHRFSLRASAHTKAAGETEASEMGFHHVGDVLGQPQPQVGAVDPERG